MASNDRSSLYISGQKPKSSILKSTFVSRLSSLFGYRPVTGEAKTEIGKKYNIEFVQVDLNNEAYRFKNAALGNIFQNKPLSENLERLFDAYMEETTLSYSDIQERQTRLNELSFLYYNDIFCSRVVKLVGDEATQLDVQDRILTVDSPNLNFSNKCYELFTRWGITQQRIQSVCQDLELYGEAFWTHKIGLNGIEKIMPIRPNTVLERLEFSPVHMSEYLAQRDGWMAMEKNRNTKIKQLVDQLTKKESLDFAENLADMFDSKLFGYHLEGDLLCPPWCMTHFRYGAENSEFYPYGRPPLLNCLAPFKQTYSSMMLQGLARAMSFPITMYKVKGTEGIGPEMAFEHVNTVREEYDNLGVNASSAGGEVYTVNTKMWVPEGLVDIGVKDAKCDIDFVGDIELYQDRVAIASGVPKAYLDQEYGGFGNSGISLTEQYKPFARHVYTIQSAFLQGLGELIRLHFAITGEFDYNTPFVLGMRFPADEMPDEKRSAMSDTMDLCTSIFDLIGKSLGLEEGEPLPEDVVTDILTKYSFLDPTDVQKWLRLSSVLKPVGGSGDEEGGDDGMGGDDFGGGDFGGGDMDMGDDMDGGDEAAPADDGGGDIAMEGRKYSHIEAKKMLRERKQYLKEARLKEVRKRYNESKEGIFIKFLEQQHLTEYQNTTSKRHMIYVPKLTENSVLYDSIQVLQNKVKPNNSQSLREDIADMMNKIEEDNSFENTKIEEGLQDLITRGDL